MVWLLQKSVKKSQRRQIAKFTINLAAPVEDRVIDTANFEEFLRSRIKIHGSKAGQGGSKVVVSRDKAKVNVAAELPFSKRLVSHERCLFCGVFISRHSSLLWRCVFNIISSLSCFFVAISDT